MKRSKNCDDAKINYIFFKNYSLVFLFVKPKGHKNGVNHVGPWWEYANPHETRLCAHLLLARYNFTYPQLLVEVSSLFEG